MKFYKLKALSVGAKGNRELLKEDNKTYPENTWHEKRAEELVELGFLIRLKDKIKSEPLEEKPKIDNEPSILDNIKGGGEDEKISKNDERKALLKEARGFAKKKGVQAPHRLMGIEKLKIFITENTVEIDNEPSILDSFQEAGGEESDEE